MNIYIILSQTEGNLEGNFQKETKLNETLGCTEQMFEIFLILFHQS